MFFSSCFVSVMYVQVCFPSFLSEGLWVRPIKFVLCKQQCNKSCHFCCYKTETDYNVHNSMRIHESHKSTVIIPFVTLSQIIM